MKKVLAFLISGLLLFSISSSCAEISIGNMSTEELIQLRNQIDQTIGYQISGELFTGIDIKEGFYSLINSTKKTITVYIYPNPEAAKSGTNKDMKQAFILAAGETGSVHLINSDVLVVSAPLLILPAVLPSWVP